ncbi:NTP transferase domain-containing protein [Polaribacter sp. HL-MS24]|uniref:NTP transferase domain-containing protein n=1 Tax=Polaribacter sp. HL-MS24 TaxID=3077735 RepID=UPI002934EE4E|nr:NTP transferase domain-containing protein [Polaribacter sp. HL-MS24]WOC40982.1 NTP transferase domain-containing protein [Polaribacter sp. HL-MS24]
MKKHQKHTHLERRDTDHFAPNEIGIVGSNCKVISSLVQQVSQKLNSYRLAYFDASHAKEVSPNLLSTFTFHHEGNVHISTLGSINPYEQRLQFAQYDLVFVNGNHYQGAKQILLLDPEKEASVLKRLDQLDQIQFVVKLQKDMDYFPFLEERYPTIKNLKCYGIDEIDQITNHLESLIQEKTPTVRGLVLVGGKSTRMGTDKSELDYHGKPQKEFLKELLEKNNLKTYSSVGSATGKENEISDTFLHLGPFGGICSAFQKDPNSAWLVLATDVPFVNDSVIQTLMQRRNPSKVATAIKGKGKEFVEPLVTIYEPKAYPILLQYLAQGYSCPRKMLINSEVEIVEIEDHYIQNVNTPEEFEQAKNQIRNT